MIMRINKTATNANNLRISEYYYQSAREGFFDLVKNMFDSGLIDYILLPGYIGWSPKEGSGIFDPLSQIKGIDIKYYRMTSDLNINLENFDQTLKSIANYRFAVLLINYFGFIDDNISIITKKIKNYSGWIIEDNAHGFFTYYNHRSSLADVTFFSYHKMLPFKNGGSLRILNKELSSIKLSGKTRCPSNTNPWIYDIDKISQIRVKNYNLLETIISENSQSELFAPLKRNLPPGIIPQSYPIKILQGNRNKIYELMNENGFGVVSLYHTLIEPLQSPEYATCLKVSSQILNLPVHQDVNNNEYNLMLTMLIDFCNYESIK